MNANWHALASALLQHYSIDESELVYIGQSGSTTFQVRDDAGRPRYLLKLYAHSAGREEPRFTAQAVRSQAQWLAALAAETDLGVAAPVRSRAGDLVTELAAPAAGQAPIHGAVLRWVSGAPLPGDWRKPTPMPITPEQALALGHMIGALHQHAQSWTRPQNFQRPRYDVQRLFRYTSALQRHVERGTLSTQDFQLVRSVARQIAKSTRDLSNTGVIWGLIHADLNPENLLFDDRTGPVPIDFDLCGEGYYLYDLAYALLWVPQLQIKNVLNGYLRISNLPRAFLPLLETFYLWATITMLKFWLPLSPQIRRQFELYRMNRAFLLRGEPL